MTITRTRKLTLIAVAFAALGLSATSASAESFWQFHHPRRAEVNARPVYPMHRHDFRVLRHERAMARFNHGYVARPHIAR